MYIQELTKNHDSIKILQFLKCIIYNFYWLLNKFRNYLFVVLIIRNVTLIILGLETDYFKSIARKSLKFNRADYH